MRIFATSRNMPKRLHKDASAEDVLYKLSVIIKAVEFDKGRFIPLDGKEPKWVYPPALVANDEIVIGSTPYTNKRGEIVNLDLAEQLILLYLLSQRIQHPLRLPSLRENLQAICDKRAEEYRESLRRLWVFNSELARRESGTVVVRRVLGAGLINTSYPAPHQVLTDNDEHPLDQVRLDSRTSGGVLCRLYRVASRVQYNGITRRNGFFSDDFGLVPKYVSTGRRKIEEDKGYWWGKGVRFDNKMLAVVRSTWENRFGVLVGTADHPLRTSQFTGVAIWTDEDPYK